MMQILLNGESISVEDNTTIHLLLHSLQIPHQQVAVAINNEIVMRSDFLNTTLLSGDKVDILKPVAGG